MNPIMLTSTLFGILMLSIVFHEFGHWIYFKRALKKNVKVKWVWRGILGSLEIGELKDYKIMTDKQYMQVNAWGIILGSIPIIIFSTINFFYILMFLPYSFGVWNDIKEMLTCINDSDILEDEE